MILYKGQDFETVVVTMKIIVFWMLCRVVWWLLMYVAASILVKGSALKMDAAHSHRMLVNFYETAQHHSGDSDTVTH
jgi:hypothetical protein